jgi:hypothetical protein
MEAGVRALFARILPAHVQPEAAKSKGQPGSGAPEDSFIDPPNMRLRPAFGQ